MYGYVIIVQVLTGSFHNTDDVGHVSIYNYSCQSTTSEVLADPGYQRCTLHFHYMCCCLVLTLMTGSDCFKPVVYPARVKNQCGQQPAILNDQLMETLRNIQQQLLGAAVMLLLYVVITCVCLFLEIVPNNVEMYTFTVL